MPWLFIILIILLLIWPIWFAVVMCDTIIGRICFIAITTVLVIVVAAGVVVSCQSISMGLNRSYTISTPKEVIDINNYYILDEKIIVSSTDNETHSFYCLNSNCIKIYEATEKQYIEVYDGTWDSSVRQFLYGDTPTIYKLYVFPQSYKGDLND